MTKRPPLVFRLMLSTLFLPPIILIGVLLCVAAMHIPPEEAWHDVSTLYGVPTAYYGIVIVLLPFIFWLWILWSGNWRRPVLTATILFGGSVLALTLDSHYESKLFQSYTPPDKRTIYMSGNISGADVFCNGVLLGQTPLHIRVDELMAKVPEWDTPPEQRWYENTTPEMRLATWIPWDDFRKERFEASKALSEENRNAGTTLKAIKARLEVLTKHEADCRYWWTYRFNDAQLAFRRSDTHYGSRSFDEQETYVASFHDGYSPSVNFHVQLLIDVLPALTPEQKTDWDRHVLKYWGLLGTSLKRALDQTAARHRREKNEPVAQLYETALHSTARMKYGLSDPPTEEECRRLLADWVKESIAHYTFRTASSSDHFFLNEGLPKVNEDVLIPADIQEPMQKPLAEQWKKNKYRNDAGWGPVVYFSWKGKSPAYFADFVRYPASTGDARWALLENQSPHVTALFKTLLYHRSPQQLMIRQIDLYPTKINAFSQIDNPLVETAMRDFMERALSDPKHTPNSRSAVERTVFWAILNRIDRNDIDKEELASWVSSLPLTASTKSFAMRWLRMRSGEALTFADQLQNAAGRNVQIETEWTLDDVQKWFDEHPEDGLPLFERAQAEDMGITVSQLPRQDEYYVPETLFFGGSVAFRGTSSRDRLPGLSPCLVRALLRSDTPEGDPQVRALIQRLWKTDASVVDSVIREEYNSVSFSEYAMQNRYRNDGRVIMDVMTLGSIGSVNLPDYILDLYLQDVDQMKSSVAQAFPPGGGTSAVWSWEIPLFIALCDSPKAEEILEKLENAKSLELWRTRRALRQRKMEAFTDLASGRMSPDELLLPQPAWVWKDGQYVPKE